MLESMCIENADIYMGFENCVCVTAQVRECRAERHQGS